LDGITLLIFANKQDLQDALSPEALSEEFNLKNVKNINWHIQGCNAKEGTGIKEGLDFIVDSL
jgi:signal recognition particle receptor subunit beta